MSKLLLLLNRRVVVAGTPLPSTDTFTAADSTDPSSRDSDTGNTRWVVQSGTFVISGNKLTKTATTANHQFVTKELSDAEVTIAADFTIGAASAAAGLVMNWHTDDTYWLIQIFQTGAKALALYERTGGTFVERASSNPTVSNGGTYRVEGSRTGDTITAKLDGGSSCNYASASMNNTKTLHGIDLYHTTVTADNWAASE
jgi:hypothetical protein